MAMGVPANLRRAKNVGNVVRVERNDLGDVASTALRSPAVQTKGKCLCRRRRCLHFDAMWVTGRRNINGGWIPILNPFEIGLARRGLRHPKYHQGLAVGVSTDQRLKAAMMDHTITPSSIDA